MILSGIFTMRSAREFATRECRLGVKLSATRISGKSRHFFREYKSCRLVCKTIGKNRLELVRCRAVRKKTKTSNHRWPTSGLGYNERLRLVRDLSPGPRGRNLCLPISLCPRWASLFLKGLLQSG